MKKILSIIAIGFMSMSAVAGPLVGTYQTIDDETNTPKSIVQLYEYPDNGDTKLAGRIIALYGADGAIAETLAAPVKIAERVKSAPTYVGLDIIWDMRWDADDNQYSGGKIMDPKSGKVYSSVIWADRDTPGQLNVRGKIGPFGRTQHWHTLDGKTVPDADAKNWTPKTGK